MAEHTLRGMRHDHRGVFGIDLGRLTLPIAGAVVVFLAFKLYTRLVGRGHQAPLTAPEDVIQRLPKDVRLQVRNGTADAAAVAAAVPHGTAAAVAGAARMLRNAGEAEELIDTLRKTKYDSDNADHEALLERLWAALKPGVTRKARKTDEWEDLGFQGKDPATDFRGNGVLGLANLVYFAENHGEAARRMLAEAAWTPERAETMVWYGLALCGINLTSDATALMKSGGLDTHFAADVQPLAADPTANPTVATHSQFYSTLLLSYHTLWLEHQPSVMEHQSFLTTHVLPANTAEKIQKA
eukprot:TRINITY_DN22670_c0_g1_i1.p1 TRINITY_DN22670_c0_g1~~TRINITY_DN22670_c0_g1_i1.p1  ORF type:complete len:298 (+),score=109.12 TRINITY_DN22670_c0_g1_i1:62-955(+)